MNLPRIYLIAVLLMAFCLGANGQEPPTAVLVDEFGVLCSEELLARYDYFLGQVHANTTAKGLIVFYGDETSEGRNISLYRFIKDWYPKVRQFQGQKLEFVRGFNQRQTKIEFWLVHEGALKTSVRPYQPFEIRSTTRYDVVRGDFHKIKGRTYFYFDGFYELGCDFGPNIFGFSQHLRTDRDLTGYLVVYSEFNKGKRYADRVITYALKHLVKNSRLPRSRFKTIYGGERKNTEVEFWLVPKGNPPPNLIPNQNTPPK